MGQRHVPFRLVLASPVGQVLALVLVLVLVVVAVALPPRMPLPMLAASVVPPLGSVVAATHSVVTWVDSSLVASSTNSILVGKHPHLIVA